MLFLCVSMFSIRPVPLGAALTGLIDRSLSALSCLPLHLGFFRRSLALPVTVRSLLPPAPQLQVGLLSWPAGTTRALPSLVSMLCGRLQIVDDTENEMTPTLY